MVQKLGVDFMHRHMANANDYSSQQSRLKDTYNHLLIP